MSVNHIDPTLLNLVSENEELNERVLVPNNYRYDYLIIDVL